MEGERSSFVDPREAYAFFGFILFCWLIMVSRYLSWLGKEYSYVCSTLITSTSSIHARRPAPQLFRTLTSNGLPDWPPSSITTSISERPTSKAARVFSHLSLFNLPPSLILAMTSSLACIRHMHPVPESRLMLRLRAVSRKCSNIIDKQLTSL